MSHDQEDRDINWKPARFALLPAILLAVLMSIPAAQAQTMTVLYNFADAGYHPWQGINMDSHGRIFGTTLNGGDLNCDGGGPPGCGVIFRFAKVGSGWIYTPLYQFVTSTIEGKHDL